MLEGCQLLGAEVAEGGRWLGSSPVPPGVDPIVLTVGGVVHMRIRAQAESGAPIFGAIVIVWDAAGRSTEPGRVRIDPEDAHGDVERALELADPGERLIEVTRTR